MPLRYLDWPFFEERHRTFAEAIARWLPEAGPATALPTEADEVRHWAQALGERDWLAACIEHDVRTLCIARQTLAEHNAVADFAFAMQGLAAGPIVLFGSAAQRDAYLPTIRSGAAVGAFAMTEPNAGSDVSGIETRARRSGS